MKAAIDISRLNISWPPILPLIAVTIAAIVVLLVGVRVEDEDSEGLGWLSLAGLGIAFVLSLAMLGQGQAVTFAGAIALDKFTAFFYLVILLAAGVTVLLSLDYVRELGLAGAEYYSMILFATLGMMLMAAANDLIIIFLGLETMSICVYVLAGMARRDAKSSEAALKYFILGAFSTGFLLYGIALLYGATGTIKLAGISTALQHPMAHDPLLLLGLGMMVIGFGFKIAAVPFHMWTPDVYEGAPTSVTAFMAAGVKLAAFAGFLRIFLVHLWPVRTEWAMVLWVMAALTMVGGNLIAVVQSNIKRMLAYSAIAHAGYIMVAMTAGGPSGGSAILFYLLGYAFTNLGAFAVIIALAQRGEANDAISDLRGLATRHPLLAASMALFMLSLTGVPPLAGFIGKFYIFAAALEAGYLWLVIIAVISSVISAYYYIGVIVAMYMDEGGVIVAPLGNRPGLVAAVAIAAIATVMLGVYPGPYISAAAGAFTSAYGPAPSHTASAPR